MTTVTYAYNPVCACQWCVNRGEQPAETASAGHSWCYEEPHIPPISVRTRFVGSNTANPAASA